MSADATRTDRQTDRRTDGQMNKGERVAAKWERIQISFDTESDC
uniref:Uncharacterized protein n=1 Tax=Anguilla anguilla TaxID=7936 RepID=A0A0E9U501_ANGAN